MRQATAKKKTPKKEPQSYWQKLVASSSTTTKLWLENTDTGNEEHPKIDSFCFENIEINAKLINSLSEFSKKQKLSLPCILHGCWGLLLNIFSGSDDVIFLTDFYNKKLKKDEKLSLLPMRSIIKNNENILSYLKNIETTLLEHDKNLNLLSSISSQLEHFSKNIGYGIFFKNNPNINFVNALSLIVVDTKKLQLKFQYDETKFSKKNIQNIIEHFIVTIEKIVKNPDQFTTHFSILTKQENELIFHKWNKTEFSKTDLVIESKFIHELFSTHANKTPEKVAAYYKDQKMTYKSLEELSNQVANMLIQKKIRPGDTVAVLMERTPLILAVMLGVFKARGIYVPLHPKYPDERIEFILNDCGAHVILVDNSSRIPKDVMYKTIVIHDDLSTKKEFSTQFKPQPALADQVAYIIYTSGTTGQPKGVMIKQESLVNLFNWYKKCFNITAEDRASQFASQGFDTFFCETIPFLAIGASIHIIEDSEKLTPSTFLPWLVQQKITICDLPTAYAQILFNTPWPDHLTLRHMKVGGESLSHYPTTALPFDIWNIYGPTEATVEAIFAKIFLANIPPSQQPCQILPPPIGKPMANCEVYIVDGHLKPVPIGIVGELLIGGKLLSPGYWNRAELTRQKFIRNIFRNTKDKLYRTGDLVRWNENGVIEFIGRVDHQVKIRGYRIELSEIEGTLRQYPDVGEVVVLANELINKQKTLIAYLVPNLEKIRIPYQERCLISRNDIKYLQAITDDISKEGLAIGGLSEPLTIGEEIRINLPLPGSSDSTWFDGKVIWQHEHHAGIKFTLNTHQKVLLQKSIEYYLSTHNLMETIKSAATKRSLRKALKKKLPEYMIPSVFSILPKFPLTFNGKIDWKALPPPQDFERLLERSYVPPRTETEKKIAAIWAEILNQPQISITDNFFDMGGNSLLVSQLSVKLFEEFNISIPGKILFDLPFIPVMGEYIDSNGQEYTENSAIQNEIQQDSTLRDSIMPVGKFSPTLHNPQNILLTGAGGFLGIFLLQELLRTTQAKIYCMVRKGGFESVASRLNANIEKYELTDVSLANRRIVIIPSDIALDQFGIPLEQYENLAGKIDCIYHCGAQVNTMASYTHLRGSNVQGTIEIIKFATHKIDKPIHYISTLSAAYRKDEKGNFMEDFPDANPTDLVGGYALSKWVSERLLTQIKNRGLPASIYRSGYIFGPMDTGITNVNDALLFLIKGCIQLGFAPDWKESFTILPVDFISQAIVGIALNHPERSGVYHLDHPKGIMWTDLIAWLNHFGFPIKICSHRHWIKKLTHIDKDNALYPFLPNYLAQTAEVEYPKTNMAHTIAALKEIKLLPFPNLDDEILTKYMNYLCQIGFFPMPQKNKKVRANLSSQ